MIEKKVNPELSRIWYDYSPQEEIEIEINGKKLNRSKWNQQISRFVTKIKKP